MALQLPSYDPVTTVILFPETEVGILVAQTAEHTPWYPLIEIHIVFCSLFYMRVGALIRFKCPRLVARA